jgi:hypothetical protein
MQSYDLLARLRTFALKSKSPTVDLASFLHALPQGTADAKDVEAGVKELSFKGALALSADGGRLMTVTLPDYPVLALVEEYGRVNSDPTRPFPREDTLPVPIPAEELGAMDAKSHLGALLEACSPEAAGAVKLLFSENVPSLVVPRRCVSGDLVESAVNRISRYLQDPKNAAYLESKLLTALRGSEVTVRQLLEDITLRPRKASSTVLSPTDFSLRFWSHLANVMASDIGAKTEKSSLDVALLQSGAIVSYAAFHMKGAAEREAERAADRKGLEGQVRKSPFVFGYQEMMLLKDEKGALLSTKHGRDFITSFLRDATTTSEEEPLPYLVRLHSPVHKKDYFVQRDMIVPVFLKKLGEASDRLRVAYIKEWIDEMKEDRTPAASRDDARFRKDVDQRVREEFPVLAALANGPILMLASESPALTDEPRADLARCFARESTLRPLYALLGLSRAKLWREARSYLPFWRTVPVIRGISRFLRMLFRGREPAEEHEEMPAPAAASIGARSAAASGNGHGRGTGAAGAGGAAATGASAADHGAADRQASDRQAQERLRRALQSLAGHFVPAGSTSEETLAELMEKWNPLLEPGPKTNLVKDVNALVQDFIRPVRRSFLAQPPDLARITALAEQLAASKSLAVIRKREPLLRYLSLYMIRSLLQQKA